MGFWWLVRSRYSVLIGCSIGLAFLLVNVYFIVFPQTNNSIQRTGAPKNKFFSPNETSYLLMNDSSHEQSSRETSESQLYLSAGHSISVELISFPASNSLPPNRQADVKHENESMQNEFEYQQHVIEGSAECEVALAQSHWLLWNLVDLVLSSLGPSTIIFALNIGIIVRISTQSRNAAEARRAPLVRPDGASDVPTPNAELQPQRRAAKASRAERSVTQMLLATSFAFLAMRTPILVGHSLQMFLNRELLEAFVEIDTCMALFAAAEMLAFGQHAVQFYVYVACSARFRQALLTQPIKFLRGIGRLLFCRTATRSQVPNTSNDIPLAHRRAQLNRLYPMSLSNFTLNSERCRHVFICIDPHVLMCCRCLTERVLHHPSCPHSRDEQRFECECLMSAVERPAHLVVHISDRQSAISRL